MILEVMLQRLYQSLLKGPGLNARPHNSRQRVDLDSLTALDAGSSRNPIRELLEKGKIEIPAKITRFKKPAYPEAEWSDEEKKHRDAWDNQTKLLKKLSAIATDAKEYFNDHGEDALFVGFPIISLPPGDDRQGFGSSRVIAPLGMIPVNIAVRTNARAGVTVTATEEGADRLVPNPALLAWIEKMTGDSSDELFSDEEGAEPWKELEEILKFVAKGVGLENASINSAADLVPVPKAEGLPDGPALLNSAVLGLFPMTNPGMIRDTKWMIENEAALEGPVRSFLKREAIHCDKPAEIPQAEEVSVEEQADFQRNFESEFLITRADPCQTSAVEEAATARALVIHGPPGTGKSQTIANIIGDHLARGERVLFVCDKRTALDVVKYRLDALGIGHLCGVIHDPQRDRKDFYMGLRKRLEDLVELDLGKNLMPRLKTVNQRLGDLHTELRGAYRALHGEDGADSFHDLVGKWMGLGDCVSIADGAENVTPALVEENQATLSELCERAKAAGLSSNPLLGAMAFSLEKFLSAKAGDFESRLEKHTAEFRLAGDGEDLPELPAGTSLAEVSRMRRSLSEGIRTFLEKDFPAATRIVLSGEMPASTLEEWREMQANVELAGIDPDRELAMQAKGTAWVIGTLNQSLVALRSYREAVSKWTGAFAFGKKKAAAAELAKFGQMLDTQQAARLEIFLNGVKVRLMLADFLASHAGLEAAAGLPDDVVLRETVSAFQLGIDLVHGVTSDCVLTKSSLREGSGEPRSRWMAGETHAVRRPRGFARGPRRVFGERRIVRDVEDRGVGC